MNGLPPESYQGHLTSLGPRAISMLIGENRCFHEAVWMLEEMQEEKHEWQKEPKLNQCEN
jgi:hypothetical protein